MFNLFNKKKDKNPISEVFHDLTLNQKMSVMNLLLTIGVCDGEQGNQNKELQYLNTYVKILDVRQDRCMSYLETYGHERIISDLKTISQSQKEFLVVAAWEMITCDGRPNETELHVAGNIFDQMGISEEKFVETIQKTQALMKYFSGK
jgi:uncharacterized tellurite resistance protein B-like protein